MAPSEGAIENRKIVRIDTVPLEQGLSCGLVRSPYLFQFAIFNLHGCYVGTLKSPRDTGVTLGLFNVLILGATRMRPTSSHDTIFNL